MKFLTTTCETYRVSSEEEVEKLIEETKRNPLFRLIKYTSQVKETKDDFYYKVDLVKVFNDIKHPESLIGVKYEKNFIEEED